MCSDFRFILIPRKGSLPPRPHGLANTLTPFSHPPPWLPHSEASFFGWRMRIRKVAKYRHYYSLPKPPFFSPPPPRFKFSPISLTSALPTFSETSSTVPSLVPVLSQALLSLVFPFPPCVRLRLFPMLLLPFCFNP